MLPRRYRERGSRARAGRIRERAGWPDEPGGRTRGPRGVRAGAQIRREVLGDDYVAQAQSRVDEFTRPFQDLLNGYCWGEIWGRPGLPRKVRSLLNLAMLTALNRPRRAAAAPARRAA